MCPRGLTAGSPSSGPARGRGQRACSRQPQGTRARGGGAPVAVAGHARLRARLLKHGGSGVKIRACSRGIGDQCDRNFAPFAYETLGRWLSPAPRGPARRSLGVGYLAVFAGGRAGGREPFAAGPARGTPPQPPRGVGP